MPVLPKSLMVLGASVQTARTSRRLKRASTAGPQQARTFRSLLGQLAGTKVGRSLALDPRMDYAAFRSHVPLRSYADLKPEIERMQEGEADVLWPGVCELYATSSGTSGGEKLLPITAEMRLHFRQAGLAALYSFCARVRSTAIFQGRHLVLGGSTAVAPLDNNRPGPARTVNLNGITALTQPDWVDQHLYEPGTRIATMNDGAAKMAAIVERTSRQDITLLAGFPNWLLGLVDAVREGNPGRQAHSDDLRAIWPNLKCVLHSGVPLDPFQDELRRALGPTVAFHEVYAACEGVVAIQDREITAGLRLLTDAGLFFEFLPLRDFVDSLPSSLGEKAVSLEHVQPGLDYVLLLTTPAGLCRHVIGDVVRFVTTEPPRLHYVGRTELQLNAFDERVSEMDLTQTLIAVCRKHRWTITNFHVAPLFINSRTGQSRGRHEWWVELRPGTTVTPTGPILAAELDRELTSRNHDYAAKRSDGRLEAPCVRLVMPGLFRHWMTKNGKWGGQSKMPRCRSDRAVADSLMAIACFTD